ncbi:MAG: hypothetical protein ACI92G_000313 [Candidatus Pelagisphaera sp.]|jgi:hypothetical protein
MGQVACILPAELLAARGELKFSDIENSVGETIQEAYSLFQDKSGYIYVSSDSGLTVYNGYDYFHYQNAASNISSLSDNSVISIVSLRDGEIWIGTRKGLNRFDIESRTFSRFSVSQLMPDLEDDHQFNALVRFGLGACRGMSINLIRIVQNSSVIWIRILERPL